MSVKMLKEYFSVSERSPVHVKPGKPIVASSKWKHIHNVGLTKTYDHPEPTIRDRFIVQCIAMETYRGKQDVVWTIDGSAVTILLKVSSVGLTEDMVRFARSIDDINREVNYDSSHVEHDYTF